VATLLPPSELRAPAITNPDEIELECCTSASVELGGRASTNGELRRRGVEGQWPGRRRAATAWGEGGGPGIKNKKQQNIFFSINQW
jgi:hypothetical protein